MSRRSAISDADLGQLVHDLLALQAGQALQLQLQDLLGLDLGHRRSARSGRRWRLGGRLASRGSARSPRPGGRGRSRSPPGRARAPPPCAARRRCAGAPRRAGSRGTARTTSSRFSTRGRWSTMASMITPKVSCSGVCLYRLFRITCEGSPLRTSTTMRMPWRSLSSRMSAMPSICLSRTSSAMRSIRRALLTWYGISVMTIDSRSPLRASISARAAHDDRCRARCGTPGGCPARPQMKPAVGKSGPGDALHHALQPLVGRQVRVLEQEEQRRPPPRPGCGAGCWWPCPPRCPAEPFTSRFGQHGRQHRRLGRAVVVGRLEVDGVLLDVRHHRRADAGQARLGVAHGGRRVAVDGAEVALAVHQQRAHVAGLGHAHQRVVDGGVAVRVVVAHHLADDLGALAVGAARLQAHLLHAVQHAPVGGLQPVAHVGQRAADDDRHGVGHVGLPHLVGDVGRGS